MYRGVCETSWGGSYFAHIRHNGKRYHLGTFKNAESAARAYDEAALSFHGSKAKLNFPLRDAAAFDEVLDDSKEGIKDKEQGKPQSSDSQ